MWLLGAGHCCGVGCQVLAFAGGGGVCQGIGAFSREGFADFRVLGSVEGGIFGGGGFRGAGTVCLWGSGDGGACYSIGSDGDLSLVVSGDFEVMGLEVLSVGCVAQEAFAEHREVIVVAEDEVVQQGQAEQFTGASHACS